MTIDWTKCSSLDASADNHSVMVFKLHDQPEYPESGKAVAIRPKDRTLCMIYFNSCSEVNVIVGE